MYSRSLSASEAEMRKAIYLNCPPWNAVTIAREWLAPIRSLAYPFNISCMILGLYFYSSKPCALEWGTQAGGSIIYLVLLFDFNLSISWEYYTYVPCISSIYTSVLTSNFFLIHTTNFIFSYICMGIKLSIGSWAVYNRSHPSKNLK